MGRRRGLRRQIWLRHISVSAQRVAQRWMQRVQAFFRFLVGGAYRRRADPRPILSASLSRVPSNP